MISGNKNRKPKIMIGKGLLPLMMAAALVMPVFRVSASKVTDLQQQKNATQNELNSAYGRASSLEGEQEAVYEEMEAANADMVENMASIELLEERIKDLEAQIAVKQAEYDAAKKDEEEQYAAMKIRVKFMYEKGNADYVQIMMQASSFSDILNKSQYIEKLYEYDRRLLVKFQETQERVKKAQKALEEEKAELEESRRGLEEEQAALQEKIDALQEQYEDFEEQIRQAQADAAVLAQRLRDQTNAISAAMEEEARAAEEARRKAEAEATRIREEQEKALAAAQQAQAEAAAQQAEQAQTAAGQTETAAAQNETEEEEDEEEEESSSSGSSSASSGTPVSSSGVTGQDVVNYACQFIGNPYVYGGSSLTNGTDCSGFTMSVYQHFGYSLGRTDVAQRSNGIAVSSIEEALPGDIICYPGHVGIYIGNGTIVHASTPATGIKYSPVTYRAYLGIRRIIY